MMQTPKVTPKAISDDEMEAEETAWQWFAQAHPHEAYATWPERFWKYFQSRYPGISLETMKELLRQTDEPKRPNNSTGTDEHE